MGLYDRNYARNVGYGYTHSSSHNEAYIVSFVKDTYKLFAASMMAGAVGAYVGVPLASTISAMFLPLVILEFALLIGLHFVKNKSGINLIVMFAFVFMTGITLSPLLSAILGLKGGATIIGNAFAMTAMVFGAMSFYAIKTATDFTTYTKPLMIALFVIIGFSLVNLFLGNSLLAIAISAGAVILFSILVVFDTQNILNGNYTSPIDGAIALYLDFLNIFTSLLQLFGIFGRDD